MSDAKYNDIYVLAVDGTKEVFYDVYKAMKVETFKRIVSMQSRGRFGAWEDMTMICLETVMEDNGKCPCICFMTFADIRPTRPEP
jgi:hypothetical protein